MRNFFTIFFVLFTLTLFAQTPPVGNSASGIGSIDGQVLDSTSKAPLEYVMLRLFKMSDSTLVSGIYTDENGSFVLDQLPAGKFYMKISNAGYRDKIIPNISLSPQKPLRKLGNIALVSTATAIEEVVVTNDKNQLQIGLDKKVYNVGDDISVTGGSANDVLNNVPSVEVDQDGKVSLRGDGNVTILIDGKPSSFTGGNGKSFLDGIPAGSIERIEIVTNPSAKYDPDGTSGIINVVLKKNIKRGLNGNVNISAGTGNAYNGGFGLSMRNTKFNLYGNYAYDYREGFRNNFNDQTQIYNGDSTVFFRQRRNGEDLSESHTSKIGMDIYLKDRNTFSWNISGNTAQRDRSGDQTNFRYLTESDTLGYWNRSSFDPGNNQNLDIGLNYNFEFKEEKGSIDWNAYQSFGNGGNEGYYQQNYTLPTGLSDLDQRLFSSESNNITTLSMDVVRLFKDKFRTESGLKMIHRNMGVNTNSDSRDASGNYVADTLAFFDYAYTERIYSAYGTLASSYKKIKYQAGLRIEKSFQEPNLISKNESYKNDYFNIFPSAYVRYAVAKSAEFSLGYSRRINRPNADNLNPFTSYADPFNLRRGNPALTPEYIHSIDFGFEWTKKKFTLTSSLYQRYVNDVINRVKIFYEDGTSAGTFANIDQSISTGGEFVAQIRPLPIWRNTVSINANYIKYIDNTSETDFNREGFVFGGKVASTLELMKKTLTLQVNGRYNAPSVSPTGRAQPRGAVDFSIDKSLKEGKWGIGLRVSDIFNTQGFRFVVEQPTITQTNEFKWETRRLYINLRYKFGRTDFNDRKRPNDGQQGGGGGGFDF